MMTPDFLKLDNPAWHSLNETHKDLSINFGKLKVYNPAYCPFGGCEGSNNIPDQIDQYSTIIDNFFIIGDKPEFTKSITLKNELVTLQMVINSKIDMLTPNEIVRLNDLHEDALFDLVNLVQPGYFKKKTIRLGDYHGIFNNGELVAVTGERMRMNDFTEVSAVVTHPNHNGKGYAKQLVAYAVNNILARGKIPYLHVTETNTAAVGLYEKLGFKVRRKMSFWNFIATLKGQH
jgi:GNAT superfamily N-acetyltransferase